MVHTIEGGLFTNHIDTPKLSLIIVFADSLQEHISLSTASGYPLLSAVHTDEQGMQAIQTGADDYILLSQSNKDFTIAIKKILTRKNVAGKRLLTNYSKGEAYELMLTALNEVIWCKNTEDFTLEYINDACEIVFGYNREELVRDHSLFIDNIHPDDRGGYLHAFQQMKDTNNLQEYAFRFQHGSGSWRHLKGRGIRVKGNEGKDLITGITVDITTLVTSEADVRERAREIEDILESTSYCLYSVDKDWNFTYLNPATERTFNVDRSQLLGKNIWDLFPRGKDTEMYTNYHLAMQEKRVIASEYFSPNINKWVYTTAYPNSNGLTVFLKDISKRKELEDKVFTDRQNLLSIINATSDVIWSVDRDMNILLGNEAFWETVTKSQRKSREDLGTKITADIFGTQTVGYWETIYARAFAGSSFKLVEAYSGLLGVSFSEISMNPIRDADNNVVGVSCFSRDITSTREHLTKIEQQNQKMREIAWIQSHKVRGPVSTILGLAQLFNIQQPHDETNQTVLEGIKETAQYLDEVIKEIVNKAKEIE
ncbi:MAG: PAS domain-containing protein [Flavipsychrobacter sp.]|nr:PAS domain-containing protein [Flavipsychrobacter sp.]